MAKIERNAHAKKNNKHRSYSRKAKRLVTFLGNGVLTLKDKTFENSLVNPVMTQLGLKFEEIRKSLVNNGPPGTVD